MATAAEVDGDLRAARTRGNLNTDGSDDCGSESCGREISDADNASRMSSASLRIAAARGRLRRCPRPRAAGASLLTLSRGRSRLSRWFPVSLAVSKKIRLTSVGESIGEEAWRVGPAKPAQREVNNSGLNSSRDEFAEIRISR